MKEISEALLATLFPAACKLCGQLVETKACGVVCQNCWDNYSPFDLSKLCQKCGYPVLNQSQVLPPKDCAYCRNIAFSIARACGAYEGAIKASILELKITPYLCLKTSKLIENTLVGSNILNGLDLILPIPLHQDRLTERGFNQAEIIAKEISNFAKVALDIISLAKIKPTTKHRLGMDKIDRSNSLKGAFQVIRPRMLENQVVLLIDDVFTTGSTISIATKELLKVKVKEVRVFTLARTIG